MPASRRASPSSTETTISRSAPPASAARGGRHHPVAVAVGLDHEPELGAARDGAAKHACVVDEGAEVDLDPGSILHRVEA